MATKIQVRRDTASDWTTTNPTLAAGEIGFESDTNKFKIGDGATAWTSLNYAPEGYITATSTDTLQNKTIDTANNTITITESDISDLGSYITATSSDTLTNKTFDANGTGNSISNIETADIAAGTLVTASEGIGSNNNDTTIPTSAAVKAYADSVGGGGGGTITALNNQAENRLVSIGSTTTELDGEANLTFDGSTLTLTGSAALDGVTITDNVITTNRSNDNLEISANGSGQVELGVPFDNIRTNTRYDYGVNKAYVNGSYDGATRIIANSEGIKATATQTTSSTNFELKAENRTQLEMAGFSLTSANEGRGLRAKAYNCVVGNENSSSASTIGVVNPVSSNVTLFTDNGNLTATNVKNYRATLQGEPTSGKTSTFTNGYNYWGKGPVDLGEGGTTAGTNYYGLYIDTGSVATNNYGVWINDDTYTNKLGGVTLQNGDITTGAVSITENKIKANRSNDSISIQGNGTGQVLLTANGGEWTVGNQDRYRNANILLFQDLDHTLGTGSGDRAYKNAIAQDVKLTSGQNSSDSDQRWRNQAIINFDLNGSSTTATSGQYRSRGPMGLEAYSTILNDSSTSATLGQASGGNYGVVVRAANTGDLTITNLTGLGTYFELNTVSGFGQAGLTISDCVGYESIGIDYYNGTGDASITDFYHFRAGAHSLSNLTLTNDYAFFTESAAAQSQFGAVRLMNQSGDPSGVADMSHIYAKDDGASSEVYVRDEAGNVTKISPHNEAGEWEYYSKNSKTGKTVRINMEKLVAEVEKLSGKSFIESE